MRWCHKAPTSPRIKLICSTLEDGGIYYIYLYLERGGGVNIDGHASFNFPNSRVSSWGDEIEAAVNPGVRDPLLSGDVDLLLQELLILLIDVFEDGLPAGRNRLFLLQISFTDV